jgi:indolepyruvate ferredoxin oxidoreductase
MWYGKGPGVDRAGDALKHGNAYGSSPHGGVLVVAGDDHGCMSSSMPHQSDVAFMAWFMPTLNPSSISEYLAFGEYGYALSRYSGMWVGFKAISETVESGQSVEVPAPRTFNAPDYTPPATGLHYRWPDLPGPQIEERMEARSRLSSPSPRPIRSTAASTTSRRLLRHRHHRQGHLDLMEALRLLGLDEKECRKLGIDITRSAWCGRWRDATRWSSSRREGDPRRRGKARHHRKPAQGIFLRLSRPQAALDGRKARRGRQPADLWIGELSPKMLAPIVAKRLDALFPNLRLLDRAAKLTPELSA